MKNIFKDDTVARTPRIASQLTMKVLFVALTVIVAAVSALHNQYAVNYNREDADNSGQYVPDDSGQYVPDDSGRYIPDRSGEYSPDGLGLYSADGSGGYRGDGSGGYRGDGSGGGGYNGNGGGYKGDGNGGDGGGGAYRGVSGGSGSSGFNRGNGFGNIGKPIASSFNGIGSTNLLGSGSNIDKQSVKPLSTYGAGAGGYGSNSGHGSGSGSGAFGNIAAGSSQVTSKSPNYGGGNPNLSGVRYDQGRYADGRWKIIRQSGDVDTDGYHWEYETENGITAEESGKLHNKGTDVEAMRAKGFFQYTGPDNVVYYVGYTADENGFLPEGNHLPTPPPIPELIRKSLDYLKATGKL